MSNHRCIVDIEGQRGFFQILFLLYENQEAVQSQLYNNKPYISISNNETACRALKLLMKYHLISEKRKHINNGKYYQLTEKGRQCVQLFLEFKKLLEQEQSINK